MRNVLITPAEVMFHAPTKQTLDARQIEQSIIIAEERFIRPELGWLFYEELILAKNLVVTDLNLSATQDLFGDEHTTLKPGDRVNAYEFMLAGQQALWKEHLWKITAECVMVIAFPEGFIQFSSEGVFHTVPPAGLMVTSGLVTPELRSVKWAMDNKIQDRIAPLMQSMHNFLCRYKTTNGYVNYVKECPCDEDAPKLKHNDFILSLYDEEDSCDCGPGWDPYRDL